MATAKKKGAAEKVDVIVRQFETREEWLNWRLGKMTGSRANKMLPDSKGKMKDEVYRAAAESIIGSAILVEEELTKQQVFDRGHELEKEAIKRFAKLTGKKVDTSLVGLESADDPRLAVSPDGRIGVTEAVEAKCLLAPKHTEALFNKCIPKNTGGYEEQMLHYFVVNPKLKTLYYVFYHPDFPAGADLFYLTFTRKELAAEIKEQEEGARQSIAKVREIVNAISLYSPDDMAKMSAVHDELINNAAEV